MSIGVTQMASAIQTCSTPDRKGIAMLYVFNSANRVQIAWNNEVPGQKPSKKRRNGMIKSFIRSLSAR
jgi:hypothetical protein